jgi:hypothetical protein
VVFWLILGTLIACLFHPKVREFMGKLGEAGTAFADSYNEVYLDDKEE